MKKTVVVVCFVNVLLAIYPICEHGASKPTVIVFIACLVTFIVICMFLMDFCKIPLASDVLETDTEYKVDSVHPEGEEAVLVISEVFALDEDVPAERPHIAVRICTKQGVPYVGELFHVDMFGHVVIDGIPRKVKDSMGARI